MYCYIFRLLGYMLPILCLTIVVCYFAKSIVMLGKVGYFYSDSILHTRLLLMTLSESHLGAQFFSERLRPSA
jgi:hypothetical protein